MSGPGIPASWQQRLACARERPTPRTAAHVMALPGDLRRAAGEVVRVHDASSGGAFVTTLRSVPIAAVAVAAAFTSENSESEPRLGATWQDIRSQRPATIAVAAWPTDFDARLHAFKTEGCGV